MNYLFLTTTVLILYEEIRMKATEIVKKLYICECGRKFDNPQCFNGHKSNCEIHHLSK